MSPENRASRVECPCALHLRSLAATAQDTTITIATVNNGDMIRMQGYTDLFTEQTGITSSGSRSRRTCCASA
jgi:sorbitol/mannitol transport system substrate-binding protein